MAALVAQLLQFATWPRMGGAQEEDGAGTQVRLYGLGAWGSHIGWRWALARLQSGQKP